MLLDDLADLLSTGGIGTVGTNLFKGTLPPEPDAAVAILGPYGGLEPVHAMAAGPGASLAERPRVQVVARDTRYDAAMKKAQDVWLLLDGLQEKTINGVKYYSIDALQSPFYLVRDENHREIFAANYEVVRRAATSS